MGLNLNQCDKSCIGCIKQYKKKHNLTAGDQFQISCRGIPKNYVSADLQASLGPEESKTALSVVDPVTWAAENLDWHCIDPDGSVWRRKDPEEYQDWIDEHPDEDILGKSRYHRPYQADMLRCTAQQKVFRIGRQAGKTESICVSILFYMVTKPGKSEDKGFDVLVVTPFQAQIDLIFKRLLELIEHSPTLQNSVDRAVKAPNYTIELHNHSTIKGFTAGTQSGGNANAIRGQHGDMLVFDEADLLSAGDMDSALSVITNSPKALVWMSSTPTGKRERFYQNSFDPEYKEFHYPSQINPLWSEKLEKRFRKGLTSIGYKHEVLAEFGEQEEGVFQNMYIQAAKADYEYLSLKYDSNWVYTIGVDWNDTRNGTTIVVVGYAPQTNHFYVVERAVVSREGWTQLSACERIAEFNRRWHPAAIYVDKGFGGTQYEVLRKFGYDSSVDPTKGHNHPDARLKDIVHQYDFGSKIEVHDLFTKQPVEKPAKPFLVENTVRRFESSTISFPKTDEALEKQLAGYVIDHISPTGTPTYKASDETAGDHVLDALMLALVAFTLQKTPLGIPTFSSNIAFSGYFGEKVDGQAEPGQLIVKQDKQRVENQKRADHRPEGMRTEGIEVERRIIATTKDGLPANHINQSHGKVGLWSWPGFSRDEPPPESPNRFRRIMKNGPPRRKNI